MKLSRLLAPALFLVAASSHAAPEPPRATMDARHKPLLATYCAKCHDEKTQKGKFRVDDLPYAITDVQSADRWQKVLNALNAGEMPPEDAKQPAPGAKADLLDDLSNAMVAARKSLGDQNGVITMRRLNRREYQNTLRELLGVEINVGALPADGGSGGFDTAGSNLFMSANQFEQYQALGREALNEAFDRVAVAGVAQKLRYECEESTPEIAALLKKKAEAKEKAAQWVKAVEEAAARPENAAVVAEIRKGAKDEALFRRSWTKIQGAPSPEKFGFVTDETPADKANRALNTNLAYMEFYLKQPALAKGAYLAIHGGDDLKSFLSVIVPYGWPVGHYTVRARVAATDRATPGRRFLEFGVNPRHGQVESTHEVTGTMEAPQVIEIPFLLTRAHSERADRTLFIREKGTDDDIFQKRRRFNEGVKLNGAGPEFVLWVDWLEIERVPEAHQPMAPGIAALQIPLDDKSKPPGIESVRTALERFATEAFRGNAPGTEYVNRLAGLYESLRKDGAKHSAALKDVMSVVLASPMFLYLSEPAADGKRRPLTGDELAVRLSYFLWSAPPDSTLRDLAKCGQLATPSVLAAQVNRLLDDPRSDAFVRAFTYQWLGMERLDFFQINGEIFQRFDKSTQLAAKNEVYETIAHLLRQNGSLRDLLKADYVVINSVLAQYYGIPGVQGDAYRKVSLPPGSPRGGLLGMAAVHVMGGNGERTSPVERGAWVLRKLLHSPPPPAPANVPAITRLADKVLTTRERLLAHQEDAQCASCHRKIDPIGLGLENFDAAGQWRTEDSYTLTDAKGKPLPKTKKTWAIEAAAALHKGPAFQDYFGLRDLIAARSDSFARGFAEALTEYGLGRELGFRDGPLLAELMNTASAKQFAMREFIHTLVRSKEFHTK